MRKDSMGAFPFFTSLRVRTWFLGPRGPLIEPSIPVHPSATIFPELKHCREASGTPQIVYFLKAHDVSYPNSDKKTNTNTNTETNAKTNTKTETNKGKTWYTYDVIYFWKGDDKRILNMICSRQRQARKDKHKDKHKQKYKDNYKDKYKNNQQTYDVICFWVPCWLWRAGCMSQDTSLLYVVFVVIVFCTFYFPSGHACQFRSQHWPWQRNKRHLKLLPTNNTDRVINMKPSIQSG